VPAPPLRVRRPVVFQRPSAACHWLVIPCASGRAHCQSQTARTTAEDDM